jgi:hypothetical protein
MSVGHFWIDEFASILIDLSVMRSMIILIFIYSIRDYYPPSQAVTYVTIPKVAIKNVPLEGHNGVNANFEYLIS